MRTLTHVVNGAECTINVPEHPEDLEQFRDFMRQNAGVPLAVDTETTGLAVFSAGFQVRLVQIGNGTTAWVLPAARYGAEVAHWLRVHATWLSHNFAYDAQVLDRHLGVTIEEMTPKLYDTIIISKLLEPHRPSGHKLKSLAEQYVDRAALDTAGGLDARFRQLGLTKETGWAGIPIDDELYVRYAGLDVIYTWRLFEKLRKLAKTLKNPDLVEFELTIQGYLNVMRRKGLRVDLTYAREMQSIFSAEAAEHLRIAREDFGLANLNSPKQVVEALLANGAELTERTPSGSYKVGKEVLLPLAGMNEYWEEIEDYHNPNELARHIARGKRAERFASAYLGKFINLADPQGRIHPDMTGLQARTSRMAVAAPPLQQLPSKDWKVRRAIIADPGHEIISADYAQIEMRLVAALANIKRMKEAIESGLDLHDYTAELAYGPSFTKANRTHMKGAGFGIVYGGGAKGLAGKLGLSVAQATAVVKAYNRVYPEIKRWSNSLQRTARANGMVLESPTGRILALDRDRTYAAINYMVQSTAADVLKNAMWKLFDQGLGDYLLMPVHDEIVAQAPAAEAPEVAKAIQEAMTTDELGMHLAADSEVYGWSWGHGYLDSSADRQLPYFAGPPA